MSVTEEIRKTLSDPKPLYALAGAGDLAAEKLKDAPALLTEVADNVTTFANRIAAQAPERIAKMQAKLAEMPATIDPKTVLDPKAARESLREAVSKTDVQALRDKAQTLALTQVGRVLEAAGKAVETYDDLAERGKTVVERYRQETPADPRRDVTVVVEQVLVDEVEEAEVKQPSGPRIEEAEVEEPAAGASSPKPPKPATGTARKAPDGGARKGPAAKKAQS